MLRDEQVSSRPRSAVEALEGVIGQGAGDAMSLHAQAAAVDLSLSARGNPGPQEEWLILARCRVRVESRSMDLVRRNAGLGRSSVGEFLVYVDRVLGRKIALDAVSRRQGLSRAVFTKSFRSSVGLSFHQYVMKRRVEVARRLLIDTLLNLAFIAEETGFSSTSHFVSVFRALIGMTPARFRERSARARLLEAEISHEGVLGSCC